MSLSDNITVVALVVSLVALVLTLLSMAQAFLATADGYRRCAKSVMGNWSKFRHRHWNWYEFRYETRFVTPQIILGSPGQIYDSELDGLPTYVLNNRDLTLDTILHSTLHYKSQSSQHNGSHPRNKNLKNLENSISGGLFRQSFLRLTGRKSGHGGSQRELRVSWLRLLQELHRLYYSYWPQDCWQCWEDRIQQRLDTKITDADTGITSSKHHQVTAPIETTNVDRTDVAVVYRSWTWDFLPPDTVKPLAESTLGDIIILARRLGMQWRTLNISDGVMQADGNGFALSSTDTKNLGMVFKFTAVKRPERFPRLIASVAADKLLCGILPGDPTFVASDFELVRNDHERTLIQVDEQGGLFARIGLAPIIINGYGDNRLPWVRNETMILLCPFMPLQNSTIANFSIDGLSPNRESVFEYWEGRYALLKALEQRIESCRNHRLLRVLEQIRDQLATLEKDFPEDFYCKYDVATITNHHRHSDGTYEEDAVGKRKSLLIETCRGMYQYTTHFFKGKGMMNKFEGRTWYMLLIGAHVRMAIDVSRPIYNQHYKSGKGDDQQQLVQKYTTDWPHLRADVRGRYIISQIIEYVRGYAVNVESGIRHHDHGIDAFFARRGIHFAEDPVVNKDLCEALWWTLMLRGVVWTMSCRYDSAGPPVPPVFYGNKTPVWIT